MADFDHNFALNEYINSSPAAAPGPPRARAVDEKEEKSKVRRGVEVRQRPALDGKQNDQGDPGELLQLIRGLAGRLDCL